MMKTRSLLFLLILPAIFSCNPDRIRITVDANVQGKPVSRNLYGKFTEHIGRNVYLGAWAQIVQNPEFVPMSLWPEENGKKVILDYLTNAENEFELSGLKEDAAKGFAAFWDASTGLQGNLEKEGIRNFQRLSSGSGQAYLQTGIFPPLHRTDRYELSVTGRAGQPVKIDIQILDMKGSVLAEDQITLNNQWSTHELDLKLQAEGHQKGSPCLLKLLINPRSEIELSRILMFPSDHIEGWEPEVIEYAREAQLPLLRYPGGNFASGYHWKDGIGPLDQRPVLPNPAWPIVEWNHVGNDEWMTFCRLIGAEPMVCINAGDGTPELAADWIRYCNDPLDTEMGSLRAKNGSAEPYDITYWEVGNELSGPWQVGHTDGAGYAERYSRFAPAMLEADPDILLVANGQLRVLEADSVIDRGGNSHWNPKLLEENGDLVRSLSVHSLAGLWLREDYDPVEVWKDLLAYADNYPDFLNALVVQPMKEAGLEPCIAITELMDRPSHPDLPNVTTISGALWYSAMINVCIRSQGLIELVTHTALLNHGGGLQKDHGIVFTDPVWWAMQLYATQKGSIPLDVSLESPTFNSSGKFIVKRENISWIDAVALMDDNGQSSSIFLANRHPDKEMDIELVLKGYAADGKVETTMIQCDDLLLSNTWDEPERITPRSSEISMEQNRIEYKLPPLSLSRLILTSE